jgi:hypothetical protein
MVSIKYNMIPLDTRQKFSQSGKQINVYFQTILTHEAQTQGLRMFRCQTLTLIIILNYEIF